MAQGEGFKHITVTAADEEDVVIRVGAPTKEEPEAAPAPAAPPEPDPEPEVEAVAPAEEHPASRPQQTERPSQPARKAPSKKKRDGYRESTLEDLESQPMPLAQKVTIIAAVVCIIGAIIYCVAFLG